MKFVLLLVALFGLVATVFADQAVHKVTHVLTDDTFFPFLEANKGARVFTKMYAPWCGHCKKLAPTWKKLGEDNDVESVIYAQIDCTQSKYVCKAFQVKSYPTLLLLDTENNKYGEHKGGRDPAILTYSAEHTVAINEMPSPPPIPTFEDKVNEFVNNLRNDIDHLWRFRKNVVCLIFGAGLLVGYILSNLCGGGKKVIVKSKTKTA